MDNDIQQINKTMHAIAEINGIDINDVTRMLPVLASIIGIYLTFSADLHNIKKDGLHELLKMTNEMIEETTYTLDVEPRVYAHGSSAVH